MRATTFPADTISGQVRSSRLPMNTQMVGTRAEVKICPGVRTAFIKLIVRRMSAYSVQISMSI